MLARALLLRFPVLAHVSASLIVEALDIVHVLAQHVEPLMARLRGHLEGAGAVDVGTRPISNNRTTAALHFTTHIWPSTNACC